MYTFKDLLPGTQFYDPATNAHFKKIDDHYAKSVTEPIIGSTAKFGPNDQVEVCNPNED